MHHSLIYCTWKAFLWIQQWVAQVLWLPEGDLIWEGMEACKQQQAAQELSVAGAWVKHWLPTQQLARTILYRILSDSLPEGLGVGDMAGEMVIINLDNEECENRLDNDWMRLYKLTAYYSPRTIIPQFLQCWTRKINNGIKLALWGWCCWWVSRSVGERAKCVEQYICTLWDCSKQ